jgi:hypothetical protein
MGKKVLVVFALLAMSLLFLSSEILANETEELEAEINNTFMFVQTAQSGTLVPVAGEDNLYTLTLMGVSPQTVAFSDRPERVVVQAPMQKFLDGMCFSPDSGPNAAIEILDADKEEDLAVVELFDPAYDDANQTLQYNVSIMKEANLTYAEFNERADKSLPESFGPAALFIDSCRNGHIYCRKNSWPHDDCGKFGIGCCWDTLSFDCEPCKSDKHYTNLCKEKFGSSCENWIHDCYIL